MEYISGHAHPGNEIDFIGECASTLYLGLIALFPINLIQN